MESDKIAVMVLDGLKWFGIAYGGYAVTIVGLMIMEHSGKPIPKEKLEEIVEEESAKLDLDSSKIDIVSALGINGARKIDQRYELTFEGKGRLTRALVRHELYHILKDCDKRKPIAFFYNNFIGEPRAVIYGALKIKL